MRIVNSCCHCISLRRATIFIGTLGIIWSILVLIITFTVNVKFRIIAANVSPLATKIITVFDLLLWIVISILLIVGACKKKIWYMFPWLILSLVIITGFFISAVYTSVVAFVNNDNLNGSVALVTGLIMTMFFIYLWIVVLSYFEELRLKRHMQYY